MSLQKDLERAKDVKEIFSIVQDSVKLAINESRAGLDLGIIDLGNSEKELLSAYYPVGSNIIMLNKTPIRRMRQTQPQLVKPYIFVILLHEYLHSLGYLDETTTRTLTVKITEQIFNASAATEMAKDMTKYFPYLLYPGGHPAGGEMQLVELDDIDYIG